MPLYEFRCTACGHIFEKIQSFSAPDPKECPQCGSPVERLLSAPAIQFKGSGFYLTDYGKAGGNKGGAKEGAASGEAKPASEAKPGGDGGKSSAPAAAAAPASSTGSGSGSSSSSTGSGSGSSSTGS